MTKKQYTPNDLRSMSKNPLHSSFWKSRGYTDVPSDASTRIAVGKGSTLPAGPVRKDMIHNPNNLNYKPKR